MTSIRRRLTGWLLAATAVLSIAAGLWLYGYVHTALIKQFDTGLEAKSHALSALLRVDRSGKVDLDFEPEQMPEYGRSGKSDFFAVIGASGAVIKKSLSLNGNDLLIPPTAGAETRVWDVKLPDGQSGRALAARAVPDLDEDDNDDKNQQSQFKPPTLLLVVARDRSEVDRVLAALASALAIAAVVLAIGGAMAVRFIVRKGLRPMDQFAQTAATIGPETLDYRFATDSLPVELQPIGRQFNDLLARLDQAFRRERRLNADIAHELRTPIAELRTLTEVASRWPCDAEKSAEYFRDAGDVARRMELLVETLLALARGQSEKLRPQIEAIQLSEILRQAIESSRGRSQRELKLTMDVSEDEIVTTDRLMLRRIIENLICNAFDYTPAGEQIRCMARTLNGHCDLTIGNNNYGLTQADLAQLFEPFWRKDAARSGDTHAGLGLSLVAEYARQLGILTTTRLPSADWFEITLTIPTETGS